MSHFGKIFTAALTSLIFAPPAMADPGEAASVNAAYAAGNETGLSPQTPSEYLNCAAHWDRWNYFMQSSNDPEFNRTVIKALSTANAKKQSKILRKRAAKTAGEWDDKSAIKKWSATAESSADKNYAAFMNNENGALVSFVKTLGICK